MGQTFISYRATTDYMAPSPPLRAAAAAAAAAASAAAAAAAIREQSGEIC